MLTKKEIADYHRDGYVISKGFFNKEEAERIYEAAVSDNVLKNSSYDLNDKSGKKTKLALWYTPGDDIYGLTVRTERIVKSVEKLLGGEPAHYHTKVMQKEPKVGGAWEWHQDFGYWHRSGFLFPQMLSVMVALTQATEENGCLKVLKGSHKLGLVQHGFEGEQVGIEQSLIDGLLERDYEPVLVELEPGDTLFFHCNTLHTSAANLSDHPRWSMISAFNRVSNKPYKEAPKSANTPINRVSDDVLKGDAIVAELSSKDMLTQETGNPTKS
ncbi:phytanoyl-CoA dioxygenase family protein [Maribacter sp. 2210JD10-5]|uniref:phytanoyl-CoA dioxygenase family protein n=1 Tax=Maribacter sp. 2210JD10-5 TaxID=3386272 RepID=UPI0039BC9B0F